jgi:hypothetical protein
MRPALVGTHRPGWAFIFQPIYAANLMRIP